MKKVLALVIAVLMLAAMTNIALAAPTYIGEVTIQVPDFDFEITLSDAAAKYGPIVESPYGASGTIVGKPGSKITFSKDISFGYMGTNDAVTAKAGEAISFDTIEGHYTYNADGSKFLMFVNESNTAGQYNEDGLTNDISEIAVATAAADPEPPVEEPAVDEPVVDEPAEEVPPVEEPEQVPDVQPAEPPVVEAPVEVAPPAAEPEAPAAPPAAAYTKPSELASAFDVGVWPIAAGTYDPGLDGNSIPNGTYVYGLFDAAYAMLTAPSSLAGYTAASSASALTPGAYYVLNASSGFGYVLVMPAAGSAPATGDSSGVVLFASVFAVAALAFVLVIPRKSKSK
ncbi:MAG: hypothetical protein LBL25_05230 [Oscillospiraceae bacterium]|jgi:hypothetical protein|nr:hypothetical protein [Oscillospiraceae bacterium]